MDADYSILFVPGIRPKPPVDDHAAQLRRCTRFGIERAGATPELASEIADRLQVVGWSHQFYGEHGDQTVDLPGLSSSTALSISSGPRPLSLSSLVGGHVPRLARTRLHRPDPAKQLVANLLDDLLGQL